MRKVSQMLNIEKLAFTLDKERLNDILKHRVDRLLLLNVYGAIVVDNILTQGLNPAGLDLFSGAENFLRDLSEEEESIISGGKRSNSNSRPRRRVRRRVRRRIARSVSRT